jgi:outer membrane immunogenic protein
MLLSAGPAAADGMPAKRAPAAAPAAPSTNWTGGQFGGFGGGSNLAQNFAEPGSHLCATSGLGALTATCTESHLLFSGDPTTFTAGAFLGYRMQVGQFVVGVEGDGAWKRATETGYLTVSSVESGFTKSEVFTGSLRQGWDGSLRGRAGYLVTPMVLVYATGGAAFGEVCGSFSYSASLTSTPGFPPFATASGANNWCGTRTGYTAGGGVEAEIMKGIKARFEYRYTDLGDFSKYVALGASSTVCGNNVFACSGTGRVDLEAAFHTFRLGLGVDLN